MENFAEQCLDMAESLLGENLESINTDGTIKPFPNELKQKNESGRVAFALGEYYRATNKISLGNFDLVDLAARTITSQLFEEASNESGIANTALGLLSFGSAKDRNPVWERLLDDTQKKLDYQLLERSDYDNYFQAFNIAKAVSRFSLGLSKKDETGKLIDKFLSRIEQNSSSNFFDNSSGEDKKISGNYDIYGSLSFIFIRQALQLHSNINLRERKLASLRTFAEKYIKIIPEMLRSDGVGWCYGKSIGAYSQMYSISIILQAMRDGWIPAEKNDLYQFTIKKLFLNFFNSFLDLEHGYLVIRDEQRNTEGHNSNRMANFDAARYLCQWSRLIKSIGNNRSANSEIKLKKIGKFINYNKTPKIEQGIFLYRDPDSNLAFQLPVTSPGDHENPSSYYPFPHSPGIFDSTINNYIPAFTPELTFGQNVFVPAYYGKNCTTRIGLRNSLQFSYSQPEFINKEGRIINNIGSCKVNWTFKGNIITAEYIFSVKNNIKLDKFRYSVLTSKPHTKYKLMNTLKLGSNGLNYKVLKDDFQAIWKNNENVHNDMNFRTAYGKIIKHDMLERDHPLIMRKGSQYKLEISFEPEILSSN